MNLALRIHMNYLEPILTGLLCQQIQKRGGSQFEPPHNIRFFQNAVDNFFAVASLNG
jgi:hypothetical protein